MSFCLTIIYILFYGNDAVDNKFAYASPYEGIDVFFVVEFDLFAWAAHEWVGNRFVCYRELKFVALYACSNTISRLSFESWLNKFAFVGFENLAFVYHIVKLASFYTFAKYEKVLEVDYTCNY